MIRITHLPGRVVLTFYHTENEFYELEIKVEQAIIFLDLLENNLLKAIESEARPSTVKALISKLNRKKSK